MNQFGQQLSTPQNGINPYSFGEVMATIIYLNGYSNSETSSIWDNIHPQIISVAKSRFNDGHYADAVEAAFKEINVRVIDMHTIKPIDREIIIKCAKETKKLISIEDHNIIGGLGSAIAEVLVEEWPTKLIRLGVKDTFGKSGKAEELMKYFKITYNDIVELF